MTKQILTQDLIKEYLHYNPDTGLFTWIKKTGKSTRLNSIAGRIKDSLYVNIQFKGKLYKAHRLAWIYVYGTINKEIIDHINGIKTDNRIVNLREASKEENQRNCKIYKINSSGYKGVSFHKLTGKWQASYRLDNKQYYLGLFSTSKEAFQAREKHAKQLHKEFYREK